MYTHPAHPFLLATARLILQSYRYKLSNLLSDVKLYFFKYYDIQIEALRKLNSTEFIGNVKNAMPTSVRPSLLMFAFNNYKIPANINVCKLLCKKNNYPFNERLLANYKSELEYLIICFHEITMLLPETQTLFKKYSYISSRICNKKLKGNETNFYLNQLINLNKRLLKERDKIAGLESAARMIALNIDT